MTIKQNLVPASKYSLKCPHAMTPVGLCIHNTANDASAKNEISYMVSNTAQTSFHFAVDDIEVWQGLPLDRNGWHAGDGASGTGNRKHIGIEICYSKSGGEKFTKAESNAIDLIVQLLKERNWTTAQVKKHQDFSGKYCPHRTLDLGWERFINTIKERMPMADDYGNMVWKSSQHDETTKSIFGADKDPRQTPSTEIMATVNGYKADATTMRNRLAEVENEVKNREEQVGRLKEQVLSEQELRKTDTAIYSEAIKAAEKLRTEYQVRMESMQLEIDEVYKQKGTLSNRISVLEAENLELKKGSTRPLSLFDVVSLIIPKIIQKLKEIKL
jgi:N-acetylmuramoyl-L-alanine amidase CwlA